MFHRESGVFKTTYSADMALYPLPIAKWTMIAIAVIFVLIIPMMVHEYYLSILNLIFIAIVARSGSTSWWATPARSRSATAPSCRSAPIPRPTWR